MLYRKIEILIEEHLKSDSKKILLIDGARQVGKTYIIRYVGKKLFENFIEVNMAEDSLGDRLFANTGTIEDFYLQISMLAGSKMKGRDNTLIFIDEIQAYPHLLTLLKFLSEDNKFTYIAGGSMLGVTLAQTPSIPIGSIRKIRMFPLDFEEFLYANGMNKLAISALQNKFERLETLDEPMHNKMMDLLRKYLLAHGYKLFYYDNRSKGEVDYLIDDYDSLSVIPIEVKSGKDYAIHSALSTFVGNEDYHIKKAFVLSNERTIKSKGKITYIPIYHIMFF